jgi:hypothetical protein
MTHFRGPQELRTILFLSPLILLEAGLFLYGSLFVVPIYDREFIAYVYDYPELKSLVFSPLSYLPLRNVLWYEYSQDIWFVFLLAFLALGSFLRFGSLRKMFQICSLAILPLPLSIYLFDRAEFNLFFVYIFQRTALDWFTNAVLLYSCVAVFSVTTFYPFARKILSTGRTT